MTSCASRDLLEEGRASIKVGGWKGALGPRGTAALGFGFGLEEEEWEDPMCWMSSSRLQNFFFRLSNGDLEVEEEGANADD